MTSSLPVPARTLTACLVGLALTLTGCTVGAPPSPGASSSPAATTTATTTTRTITDQHGSTVQVPVTVQRVAPSIGAFAHITAMLGAPEKVVATSAGMSDLFYTVWPTANRDRRDAANIEEIIAGGAQVAYGPNFTDEQKAQLTAAGVSVVTIDAFADPEQMKKTIALIAEILGGDAPARATEFNRAYDGYLSDARERAAKIPANEHVTVLNLRTSGDSYTTVGGQDISSAYGEAAGGTVVSADFKGNATSMTVSAEQILAWAPQVIYTMGRASHDRIVADPALQAVPAVRNGRVHTEPSGTYPWSVRSAEGALMPAYIGSILYPQAYQDVSLATLTKDFYQKFYGYTLSDDQVTTILAGRP